MLDPVIGADPLIGAGNSAYHLMSHHKTTVAGKGGANQPILHAMSSTPPEPSAEAVPVDEAPAQQHPAAAATLAQTSSPRGGSPPPQVGMASKWHARLATYRKPTVPADVAGGGQREGEGVGPTTPGGGGLGGGARKPRDADWYLGAGAAGSPFHENAWAVYDPQRPAGDGGGGSARQSPGEGGGKVKSRAEAEALLAQEQEAYQRLVENNAMAKIARGVMQNWNKTLSNNYLADPPGEFVFDELVDNLVVKEHLERMEVVRQISTADHGSSAASEAPSASRGRPTTPSMRGLAPLGTTHSANNPLPSFERERSEVEDHVAGLSSQRTREDEAMAVLARGLMDGWNRTLGAMQPSSAPKSMGARSRSEPWHAAGGGGAKGDTLDEYDRAICEYEEEGGEGEEEDGNDAFFAVNRELELLNVLGGLKRKASPDETPESNPTVDLEEEEAPAPADPPAEEWQVGEVADSPETSVRCEYSPWVSDGKIKVVVVVREAKGLEKTRTWRSSDPFCIVECEGVPLSTPPAFSTQNPKWEMQMVFRAKDLNSRMRVQIFDRHAVQGREFMGVAGFRLVDMLKRAMVGYTGDTEPTLSSWFVLKGKEGSHKSGALHLFFRFDKEAVGHEVSVETVEEEAKYVGLAEVASDIVAGLDDGGTGDKDQKHDMGRMSLLDLINSRSPVEQTLAAGCEDHSYAARSLGVFDQWNGLRRICFDVAGFTPFQILSWVACVAALVTFAMEENTVDPAGMTSAEVVELACYCFLGFEMLVKVVAYGLVGGAGSFLTVSLFNVVDLCVFLSYWIEMGLPDDRKHDWSLRAFRTYRVLRPLTQFSSFAGISGIFRCLRYAMREITAAIAFLGLFLMGFSVFGITFYNRSFSRRCVTADTLVEVLPEKWCKGDSCGEGMVCADDFGNPSPMHFDNIGAALLSMMQLVSFDGQYEVMTRALQSEPSFASVGVLYFVLITVSCRYVLFFLCLGAVTTTFQRVRLELDAVQGTERPDADDADDVHLGLPDARPPSREGAKEPAGGGATNNKVHPAAASPREDSARTSPGGGPRTSPGSGDLARIPTDSEAQFSARVQYAGAEAPAHAVTQADRFRQGERPPGRAVHPFDAGHRRNSGGILKQPQSPFGSAMSMATGVLLLNADASPRVDEPPRADEHGPESPKSGKKVTVARRGVRREDSALEPITTTEYAQIARIERKKRKQTSVAHAVQKMSAHPMFEVAVLANILVHIVVLAVNDFQNSALWNLDLWTRVLFIVEFTMRLMASRTLSKLLSHGLHSFDALCVLFSCAYLFSSLLDATPESQAMLRSLTALRFVRIVALSPVIMHLFRMAFASFTNISNLIIFVFTSVFMFALVGTYTIRRGASPGDDGFPVHTDVAGSSNFTSVARAMLSLFMVMSGDSWRFALIDVLNTGADADWRPSGSPLPAMFVVGWFLFSQTVLLNLFVAVIVENFTVSSAQKAFEVDRARLERARGTLYGLLPEAVRGLYASLRAETISQGRRARSATSWLRVGVSVSSSAAQIHMPDIDKAEARKLVQLKEAPPLRLLTQREEEELLLLKSRQRDHVKGRDQEERDILKAEMQAVTSAAFLDMHQDHHSCMVLSKNNPVRLAAMGVNRARWWEAVSVANVMLSLGLLCADSSSPSIPPPIPESLLFTAYTVHVVIFAVEIVVAMLHQGVVFHPECFLRELSNVFDFAVFVLTLADYAGGYNLFGRLLRPLRLIKRSRGIRSVIAKILSTISPVLMVIGIAATFLCVFAVIGMALFQGRLGYCTAAATPNLSLCSGNLAVSASTGGLLYLPQAWLVPEYNFESFGRSVLSLFTVGTLKYSDLVNTCTSMTSPDTQPSPGASTWYAAYFVVFIVIGAFFVMNLFVAFIIDGYNILARQQSKEIKERLQYRRYLALIRGLSPINQQDPPQNIVSTFVRNDIVRTRAFATVQFLVVVLIAGFQASWNVDQSASLDAFTDQAFLIVIIVESLAMIVAFGPRAFFDDWWNRLDALIIGGALAATVSTLSFSVTLSRTFVCLRILKIIKFVPPLRRVFSLLLEELVQYANIIMLMFVVFFVYAIIMNSYLGTLREGFLRVGGPLENWPSSRPNFKLVGNAVFSLLMIVQGDEWHHLMHDAMVQPPFCTERGEGLEYGDCGMGFASSWILFGSFKLIAEYMLVNLFIGMILDTFAATDEGDVEFNFTTDMSNNADGDSKSNAERPGSERSSARGSSWKGSFNKKSTQTRASVVGSIADGSARLRNCMEAWHTFSQGEKYEEMQIADVNNLMRCLPQPLGYSRDAFGEPIISFRERAVMKLIRAELNLIGIVRRREQLREENWQLKRRMDAERGTPFDILISKIDTVRHVWVNPLTPAASNAKMCTFEDAFVTVFYWRCPDLIPESVRVLRSEIVPSIVETAHALAISRLVSRAAMHRRMAKASKTSHRPGSGEAITTTLMLWQTQHADLEEAKEGKQVGRRESGEQVTLF